MKAILIISSLIILASCYKSGTNEQNTFKVIDLNAIDKVSFSLLKKEVLNENCLECHDWCAKESDFKKHLKEGDPANSSVYNKSEDGTMPIGKPPLDTMKLEILERYIKDLVN